jgi:hypothetical protein
MQLFRRFSIFYPKKRKSPWNIFLSSLNPERKAVPDKKWFFIFLLNHAKAAVLMILPKIPSVTDARFFVVCRLLLSVVKYS